jgi:hypothetical protein
VTAILLLLPLCAPAALYAPAPPARSQTSGLALGIEGARHAGGLGVTALYYYPLPDRPFTLSAQLGAGISGAVPRTPVAAGGAGVSYGRRHRAVLAIAWGALGRSTLLLHGTQVAERTLYGPGLEAGYEYVSDRGLLFRALAGGAYLSRAWQEQLARLVPTAAVALGWKLW